ncbi:ABC transporter substrate-binding protein [Dactylosporangium sp. NPDC000555]|uniref:ABC transporter substrate-binding protein n=1 Tax=Dactylosporangium sp. NPDC000555 TaxID=3154260 RepID=UPI0033186D52
MKALLAAALSVSLAACADAAKTPAGGESGGAINPDAILRVALPSPIRTFDPALVASYGENGYLALTYDRLTMLDKNDNLIAGLATKWEFSADGSSLTLTLREGVSFNDGTPFNAAAVKANIERSKTFEKSTLKSAFADITAVTAVDDTHVRFTLRAGGGVQLLSTFTTNAGMMISPKAIADPSYDLANNPGDATTGPYVVTQFTPNEGFKMKKAPRTYWDPAAGRLGGVEVSFIQDGTTRVRGVQTGQLDLSTANSPADIVTVQKLADQGQLNIAKTRYRNILGVYLRANQGDLAKPEVRQAVAHAIDPNAVKALFSGYCTPTQQLYPDSTPWAIPNYRYPYAHNVEKAKELVSQAGGAKVTVTFPAGSNVEQSANVVQAALSAAGIQASLNPVPTSENEPRFIKGDFELMVANSFSPKVDPAETFNTYFSPSGTYKLAVEPQATQLAKDATAAASPTLSEDKRAPLYQDLTKTIMEQAWFIPICNMTQSAIANSKVVGYDNIPWMSIGITDLRYVAMVR